MGFGVWGLGFWGFGVLGSWGFGVRFGVSGVGCRDILAVLHRDYNRGGGTTIVPPGVQALARQTAGRS